VDEIARDERRRPSSNANSRLAIDGVMTYKIGSSGADDFSCMPDISRAIPLKEYDP
jgi:hypothetical protein